MAKSSDSSDGGVPTKVASFHKAQKLTLLDTKGKKREVRLDRKMKRKMKKREKKKAKRNYVKGKVIDGHHELYTLSIAMMLGLRYSIFLTNNQLVEDKKDDRMWLDSDEFMKVENSKDLFEFYDTFYTYIHSQFGTVNLNAFEKGEWESIKSVGALQGLYDDFQGYRKREADIKNTI